MRQRRPQHRPLPRALRTARRTAAASRQGRARRPALPRAPRAWYHDLLWRTPLHAASSCPATDEARIAAAMQRRPSTFLSVAFTALLAMILSRRPGR